VNNRTINSPQHEAKFVHREKELADFVENARVALQWLALDGTILWANKAQLELVGHERGEYVGRSIRDFHVDRAVIDNFLSRQQRHEDLNGYEARMRCKDGSIRHVRIASRLYREDNGSLRTHCTTFDITEEKRSKELEERLAAVAELSNDAIINQDLNGVIQSWNRSAERIFGYTADEVIGKPIRILALPHEEDETPKLLDRILQGKRIEQYETRRKTKHGQIISISLAVSPITDASGRTVGACNIASDVTESRRTVEIQERLAALVESSDDAIIGEDLNGIIQSWNRGAQRIFGYRANEVIGKPITILAVPGRLDEIPQILERIARGERVDHFETQRKAKDGRILFVSLTLSPIRDGTGRIIGASKIARDITERVQAEEALREANAALIRANADLEQFAYSASHDLREPLRMVASYSELLKRRFGSELDETGELYIRYVVEGAHRMEKLLKDLLTYIRISKERAEPAEEADANYALEQALANLQAAITASSACITHTALPKVHIQSFQLEQVFQNLIGNAIRYRREETPEIHVAAELRGQEWVFSVKDNGIGISPKYKDRIFGMFKRLHTSSDYPGTGMGLAICQRIVERAGGRIWVESEVGKGSTFFFTIPAR